jgi:hypothetical protein
MGCDRNADEGCLVACGEGVWAFLLGCFNSVGTGKAAAVRLLVAAGGVGEAVAIAVAAGILGGAVAIAETVSGGGTSMAMALLVAGF